MSTLTLRLSAISWLLGPPSQGAALPRLLSILSSLKSITDNNKSLARFVNEYEKNAELLAPNGIPEADIIDPRAKLAISLQAEQDLRSALRDLQILDEKKAVVAAGTLEGHYKLVPRLKALIKTDEKESQKHREMQRRVEAILQRYTEYVDTISRIFLTLDDQLCQMERQVKALERK